MNSKEWSKEQDTHWAGTVIGEARDYMKKLIENPDATVLHEFSPMRDLWELTAYTTIGEKRYRVDAELRINLDEAEKREWKMPVPIEAKLIMAEQVASQLLWNMGKR